MGFRQFFKRAVKPAVMVGIVGTLSVSLIVTTPSNAQAFVPPPVVPLVFGATEMVIPTLTPVASVLGPVGWGLLALTAVGVAAYATRDSWVPYVTGNFGKAEKAPPSRDVSTAPMPSPSPTPSPSPSASATPTATATATPIAPVFAGQAFNPQTASPPGLKPTADGKGYTSYGYYSGNDYNYGAISGIHMTIACKNASGSVQNVAFSTTAGFGSNSTFAPRGWGQTATCPNGATAVGAIVGRAGADPALPQYCPASPSSPCGKGGPLNVVTDGIMTPDVRPEVNPRTDGTKYRTTVECVKNDGTLVSLSAESLGGSGGLTLPSCAAAGLGHGTGKIQVDGFLDGSAQPQRLLDKPQTVPDPNMPMCDPRKPGSGCKLSLSLDGKPCVAGLFECEHWSDISRDPNQTPRYGCQYGPYVVALALCNPLERAFEPGGAPTTDPNTDGNPDTRSDTGPDGKPQPRPNPDGTIPGVDPTAIIPGAGAAGPPEGATPDQKQCFPSGWAVLNPVEWVMKPVGCALDSAFRPKKDLQTRLTGMQSKFSNKVPLTWFGVGMEGASGGGCPADWAVTFEGQRYSLICGTQADSLLRGFRPVLGGMLITAMLWPFLRSLFYAAIPVFKVTPS